jgi:hypothetical protein
LGGIGNSRAFGATVCLLRNPISKLCGAYCTKFEPILKAIQTRNEAPASGLPSADTGKMFLTISDSARVRKIFLKGQDIFSVFCPQGLGQGLKTQKHNKD